MSISEQVKELREIAKEFDLDDKEELAIMLNESADTIESLSAKLQAANMERFDTISRSKLIEEIEKEIDGIIVKDTYSKGKNAGLRKAKILAKEQETECCGGGWIPCSERLPEEKINPITQDFYEYQVTFQSENIKDIRHYKFGRGHWWNGPGIMDEYVIAWRQNIEPYHEP